MKNFIIKITLALLFISFLGFNTNAQIAINSDGSSPDASAMLEITSDSKGILIPRMTTLERTAISSPATGLLVYDTNFNTFWYYANSTWNNLSNVLLQDSDADTKIQVEESSDEDIIRFDLGGTEFFKFDEGRIDVLNTGSSVFLGNGAGGNDDYSDNLNVFIGDSAGYSNTTGDYNSFIGLEAGYSNIDGIQNTFIGTNAGHENTSGIGNEFLGYSSGYSNTTGSHNIFLGHQSGNRNTTGYYNTFLGSSAGYLNTTGYQNIFIGHQSGFLETGSNKLYIENSSSSLPLIYGDFENDTIKVYGTLGIKDAYHFPIIDGTTSQTLITDGNGTLTWSDVSTSFLTENGITHSSNNDDDFVFGADSLNYGTGTESKFFFNNGKDAFRFGTIINNNWDEDSLGLYSIGLGHSVKASGFLSIGIGNSTDANGSYSMALGSGTIASGVYSTALGTTTTASGVYSTAFGTNTIASGDFSTTLGFTTKAFSFGETALGIFNTTYTPNATGSFDSNDRLFVIGNGTADANRSDAMIVYKNGNTEINGALTIDSTYTFPTIDGANGQVLTTDGSGSLTWASSVVGATTSVQDTDGDTKIQVEESSDEDIIRFDLAGTEYFKFDKGRIDVLNTGSSVFLGNEAGLNDNYSDNRNVFIGNAAGFSNTTGRDNVFQGYQSGYFNTTGYFNTFTGYFSGYSNTTGSNNSFLGHYSGYSNTTGSNNSFLGYQTGVRNTTGANNIILGYKAGFENTTGANNIILGYQAGFENTTGSFNSFTGSSAGYENTTGSFNSFTGSSAGYENTTGSNNSFFGSEAGYSNTKGSNNVFIGYQAGYSETESNKLYIDNSDTIVPLIYGDFDSDSLQINGTLNIGGNYAFPTNDGDTSQILVTDGSGILTWTNLNTTLITDADNDTKIQVEESSDEDVIRFDLGGTEFMRLDSGRMEIVNTGNSIFIGEDAGLNDDYTSNNNIFLGYQAGYENTSGYSNLFLGYKSGYENTSGNSNLFLGNSAGKNNTNGHGNIFLGNETGEENDKGDYNVYIGHQAGNSNESGIKNVYIGYRAGKNALDSNKLYIENSAVDQPLIYGDFENDILEFNGNVGIGTTPINAKFEVLGEADSLDLYTFGYLNNSGATGKWTDAPAYSIYADGKIAGFSFHAHSDERIKNIQGISNSKDDLNTLMNIEITNYTMKDSISKGNQVTKKVIAQQVKSVYPKAVSTNTIQVVPDIYKTATIDENGWISFNGQWTIENGQLQKGDKVQIIFEDKKEILEVLETKGNSFRIETLQCNVCTEESTVFVYGKQVDDFHTVDYEAISMLNVSATQQLAKEVEELKKENKLLKAQVSEVQDLKIIVQQLQAQLEN